MKNMIMKDYNEFKKGDSVLVSNNAEKASGFKIRVVSHYNKGTDTLFCYEKHNEIVEYLFAYPLEENEHILKIQKIVSLEEE